MYPPVATDRFAPGPVGENYLVLSELVSHKDIELAVEAFNQLRLPLVDGGRRAGQAPPRAARRADGALRRAVSATPMRPG